MYNIKIREKQIYETTEKLSDTIKKFGKTE